MTTKKKINGFFVGHRIEVIGSPAYAAAGKTARRILDCIEVEWSTNGKGQNNGAIIFTHKKFRKAGIHHDAVGPAVREVEALGLASVKRGVAGKGKQNAASVFRLTYLPADGKEPTDEWRAIKTIQEAKMIAKKARKAIPESHRGKKKRQSRYPGQSPVPVSGTIDPGMADFASPGIRDRKNLDLSLPGARCSSLGKEAREGKEEAAALPRTGAARRWGDLTIEERAALCRQVVDAADARLRARGAVAGSPGRQRTIISKEAAHA